MKRVDCKIRKWTSRAGRGVNEIEICFRQEKDVSDCFVGCICPQAGENRQICI
jgi:hypothetical protein